VKECKLKADNATNETRHGEKHASNKIVRGREKRYDPINPPLNGTADLDARVADVGINGGVFVAEGEQQLRPGGAV
jgi:hypothetical protein